VTQLGLSAVQMVERQHRLGRIIRERIAAMSDIEERLQASICGDRCRSMEAKLGCECAEAADTIEALRAENERLRNNGYAVVPVEPTEAMITAGEFAWMNRKIGQDSGPLEDCYRAMIAAAQGEG